MRVRFPLPAIFAGRIVRNAGVSQSQLAIEVTAYPAETDIFRQPAFLPVQFADVPVASLSDPSGEAFGGGEL